MALTLVGSAIAGVTSPTLVTSSVTPPAGGTLVLFAHTLHQTASPGADPTCTGLGGTWTRRATLLRTDGSFRTSTNIFTTTDHDAVAGTATVTWPSDGQVKAWALWHFPDSDAIDFVSADAVGGTDTNAAVTLTGSPDLILYGGTASLGNFTFTPLSGYTEGADATFNDVVRHTSGYDLTAPSLTAGATVSSTPNRWTMAAIGFSAAGGEVDLGSGSVNAAATASTSSFRIGDKQTVAISVGNDDGYQQGSTVNLTNTSVLIINDRTTAYRFQGVQIPQGSTITKATLTLTCSDTKHNDANMTIWCNDVDNAAALATTSNYITNLVRTTDSASWVQLDLFTDTTTPRTSPNIIAPIQEVISRTGWAISNAVTLIVSGNNNTNNLNAKTFEGSAPASLGLVWLPPPQTIALTGSVNAAATCIGSLTRSLALSGSANAGATLRSGRTTTVSWDGDDFATHWTQEGVNEDEVVAGTTAPSTFNFEETGNEVEFWIDPWNSNGGTRSYSGRRDFVVFTGGPTFKDGTIRVMYDPPRFVSGSPPNTFRPQHGVLARWVDNTDHQLGIVVWHDITVPFPGVQNFGVWRTERPMSSYTSQTDPPSTVRRTTANTPGFGLSGDTFPYWVEVEFIGERVRIRTWEDGQAVPAWDSSTAAAARDLSEAATPGSGNTAYSRTPTPAEGKVGLMVGHVSQRDMSAARFAEFSVTQFDTMDVSQDLGAGSASAAATVTGSLSVARPLSGSVSAAATVTGELPVERPLAGTSSAAATVTSQLLDVLVGLAGSSSAAATVVGVLDVEEGTPIDLDFPPGTLTAVGDPLTLTSVGSSLTLRSSGSRLTLTSIEE